MSSVRISEAKIQTVEKLKSELLSYPIIGLVKIENINARVVQKMRSELRKEAKIVMAKNNLMKLAIDQVKDKVKGIEQLKEYIKGPCAFLLTKTNPFKLATYMNTNKVPAPAKPGQIASNDIVVPAMNTGIPPGPVISELQSLGLKTRIEGGQIKIAEPSVVTKEGEKVTRSVALLLRRLNIEPFFVGLSMTVALQDGTLLHGKDLIVDYEQYLNNLQYAHSRALNLAVNAGIVTKRSLPILIQKVYQQAINLTVNAGIATTRTLPMLLAKVRSQALALTRIIGEIDSNAVSAKALEAAKTASVAQKTTVSTDNKQKQEEKEEEPEEEEEDLGLGALFG
ncbi:MAG: 50S ribosomal protein L10 [Candidatus Heimdallarchaeum aukensis]|uniref:Large ribosomal subunit protein uL10 n=1 Tax=Candidatus Heimdallarchaeum aukensis TaxID=2876573 RepID=A0A9Y1FJF4_9ARCH|nr:MAG: 50S ribosomal protein L10 [Candidatus Heimdallarchaeum aukensis]